MGRNKKKRRKSKPGSPRRSDPGSGSGSERRSEPELPVSSPVGILRGPELDALGGEGAGILGEAGGAQIEGEPMDEGSVAVTDAALRSLLVVTLVLVAAAGLSYLLPGLSSFQPWRGGDGLPIVRMFQRGPSGGAGMEVATGGASGHAEGSSSQDQLAEELGDAVAANLGEEEEGPDFEGDPEPGGEEPGGEEVAVAGVGEGEGQGETPRERQGPQVRVSPSELEGLAREIEDRDGRAMRAFYQALERTARREEGAMTRIAQYGDSSIGNDGITVTLRRRMQRRFGEGGHGFVLLARGDMPYRHMDIRHESEGAWRLMKLVRGNLSDGLYGIGGVQYRATHGPSATFGTDDRGSVGRTASRFELFFLRHPRGGHVQVRADQGEWVTVDTRGDSTEAASHTLDVPDGEHRFEVRAVGHGELRLFGAALERAAPAVVVDSLGLIGARARRLLSYDAAHFAEVHRQRGTNLIVLGFGGNDADDVRRTPEQFQDDFVQLIRMVRRARPEASCLLFAPLDQGERDERGNIVTIPLVPQIVEAQRRAARAEGCAFFDTYAAMGGEGAMRRWFRSRPRLAFPDYRHATPAGYNVIGNMFYKALLKGFADYLARERGETPHPLAPPGVPAPAPPAEEN